VEIRLATRAATDVEYNWKFYVTIMVMALSWITREQKTATRQITVILP
jgi:hypothetical protein